MVGEGQAMLGQLQELVRLRRMIRHARRRLRRRRIQVARLRRQGGEHRQASRLLRHLGWILERLLQRRWSGVHGYGSQDLPAAGTTSHLILAPARSIPSPSAVGEP
jgi:hypothetical protein